jgi:hypothetical protein
MFSDKLVDLAAHISKLLHVGMGSTSHSIKKRGQLMSLNAMRVMPRVRILAAASLVAILSLSSLARAERIDFLVDGSQSYLTLSIPNFSVSGISVSVTGQNRTNGAPLTTAWGTNTGNTAVLSGNFSTTISGNFYGGTINSIQFVTGTSTMTALASGNYRPNPAAYNSSPPTPGYTNNSPHAANYGGTLHTASIGNAGYFSLSNSTYDIQSASPISVIGNQFPVNLAGNSLITGLSTSTFGLQGGNLFLAGAISDQLTSLTGLVAADTSTSMAKFVYAPNDFSATLTIPISVPISIPVGGGIFLNGTATGQIVALSPIAPEPSAFALAGLGAASLLVMVRRRRKRASGS